MPDIDVQCPNCGQIITISEYADLSSVKCRSCGSLMKEEQPEPEPEPEEEEEEDQQEYIAEQQAEEVQQPQKVIKKGRSSKLKRRTGPSKMGNVHFCCSWIIFVAVSIIMCHFRYGGSLSPANLDTLKQVGPYIALLVHAFIITQAYHDSMFHGILATFVPGYSFCYIIMGIDNYYTRAVLGGLLIGVAQDTFTVCKDVIMEMLENFGFWVEKGVYD